MRCTLFVATGILLSAMLSPLAVHAQSDDVLLPSEDESGSSPNLGLVPSYQQKAGGTVTATPQPVATPAASNMASSPPPPMPETSAMSAPQAAPPPQMTLAPLPKISDIMSSTISDQAAAQLPPGKIRTTIIHQPDLSTVMADAGKNLPYSLTVSIGGGSVYSAKDIQKIRSKLGLSTDDIASACIMTVRGIVRTDQGSYLLSGNVSPQAVVHYGGMIKSYIMSAHALCAANNLPSGGGFLTETNGRFSIPLQPIHCAPPNQQVTSLTVTYNGGNTSQCSYD
ncbi:MAG: hypothetical protein WCD70_00495 [Alphaproteobacteria bacterium]